MVGTRSRHGGGAASIRYGFERLDACRVVSICTPDNLASRRVMDKLGLRLLAEKRHASLGVRRWIYARDRDRRAKGREADEPSVH